MLLYLRQRKKIWKNTEFSKKIQKLPAEFYGTYGVCPGGHFTSSGARFHSVRPGAKEYA